jgi:hypothetical protein
MNFSNSVHIERKISLHLLLLNDEKINVCCVLANTSLTFERHRNFFDVGNFVTGLSTSYFVSQSKNFSQVNFNEFVHPSHMYIGPYYGCWKS